MKQCHPVLTLLWYILKYAFPKLEVYLTAEIYYGRLNKDLPTEPILKKYIYYEFIRVTGEEELEKIK